MKATLSVVANPVDAVKRASSSMGDVAAVSVLVITGGAGVFAAFCPSWFTVRSPFFHEQSARDGNVAAIRQGEIAGTAVTLLMGGASSFLVKSPIPFLAGLATSALMVAGYEYSMTHPAQAVSENPSADMSSLHRAMAWRGASAIAPELLAA